MRVGSHEYYFVDTSSSRAIAKQRAELLYTRWIEHCIIEPQLTDVGEWHKAVFRFCVEKQGFMPWMRANLGAMAFDIEPIDCVKIRLYGHEWQMDNGQARLVAVERPNSGYEKIFHNNDGGFSAYCPVCDFEMDINTEDVDWFVEPMSMWFEQDDAIVSCPQCHSENHIMSWHSNTFAAGYLAFEFYSQSCGAIMYANETSVEVFLLELLLTQDEIKDFVAVDNNV